MNFKHYGAWDNVIESGITLSKTLCGLIHFFSHHRIFKRLIYLIILCGLTIDIHAAPFDGKVIAGSGNIQASGATTTIHQQSQHLSINWNGFDISEKETVNFNQPGANAIAVNRVVGSHQASQIQGHLNANGQVWLINPNGILFAKDSSINVGGLLASTLDIADNELNQSHRKFSGSSTANIVNKGHIRTIKGGYVAMIANTVSNRGHITTPQGATALAAGSEVTVTFADHQLTGIRVDKSTLNNLVENKQVIRSHGGTVIMTAGAHDSLLRSAVNNDGIVEAQTIHNHKGNIILLGGMKAGTTTVKGELNASAPRGGNGGNIETSAARVHIDPKVKITTLSPHGINGTWLIDPQDYTIAKNVGDITGSQVSNLLNTNNIIISSAQGQNSGSGNLNLNDVISWNNSNTLTLQAENDVNFNTGGEITNTTGGTLNVRADSEATGTGTIVMGGGSINVSGTGGAINFYYNPSSFGKPSTFAKVTASNGAVFTPYMLTNSPDQLSAIASNAAQNYALAKNLDFTSITNFKPINFSGNFDGQNYSISNLKISGTNNTGMFGSIAAAATVKNLILTDVNVSGTYNVGALAGTNNGRVENIIASGSVLASNYSVGGIFGRSTATSSGTNIDSRVHVTTTGTSGVSYYVGGLVGYMTGGTYINDAVSGDITTKDHIYYVGGFSGYAAGASKVTQSSYTGNMTTPLDGYLGGFMGYSTATITGCYTTANINGGDWNFSSNGGFVGWNAGGKIDSSYATGNVVMGQAWHSSAFVGWNAGDISNSYSTGNFTVSPGPIPGGNGTIGLIKNYGGLVGYNASGKISNSYATGKITALGVSERPPYYVGGLVGDLAGGSIERSYATGDVTAVGGGDSFGGLVGIARVPLTNVYASGNVTATAGASGKAPDHIGGLIGYKSGSLTNGYSVGRVTAETNSKTVGGLIGYFSGPISGRSFWDSTTSGQASSGGGASVVGMPTEEMHNPANFTSATSANGNVNPNWDFSKIWGMDTGSYSYPVFNPAIGPVTPPGPQPPPAKFISYYPLTVNNLKARNKIYDGTTDATVAGTLSGLLPKDDVSISIFSGKFNDKNVGAAKLVDINTPILSGEQVDKYVLVPLSNTTTADITPLAITLTADGVNKVYNGNRVATVNNVTSRGIISSDHVSVNYNNASFDNKNVGTGKTVTVEGITLTGSDAANYTVNQPIITTANITLLAIDVAADGENKVYDGNTTAQVTLSGAGVIAGDEVSFTRSAANFIDKNVGTNKPIDVTGISTSGSDARNYTVNTTATTAANITPLTITITAEGVNKVYDGNTAAKVTNIKSSDIISPDDVSINYNDARFVNRNVGTVKKVAVNGIYLTGSDAVNYIVDQPFTTSANITPLAISINAKGINKIYDGNLEATVNNLSSNEIISPDQVIVNYKDAKFDDKNVGTGKTVRVTGITLSGGQAGNYIVNQPVIATANITPLAITLTAEGVNKVYNGNRVATVNNVTSRGIISSDQVNINYNEASFEDKNVGTAKKVNVTGISLTGIDSKNYIVNQPITTSADITPLAITVTADGENKIYNGNREASVTHMTSRGIIHPDEVIVDYNSAKFDDKNVGTNKTITVNGITLTGSDAGNYTVNTTATTEANITPLAITLTAEGVNKVYNGNKVATVNNVTSRGIISSDQVNINYNEASFEDKNVGTGKTVSVNGITLTGSDSGNYIVNQPVIATANITPLAITLTAEGVNKVYNGNRVATVNNVTSRGIIHPDEVIVDYNNAKFDDKNVGTNKTITVNGITLTGSDSGNYIVNQPVIATANITPLAITLTAEGVNKVYNGNRVATVNNVTSRGIIHPDEVIVDYNNAKFDDKNVGTNKTITINGITLTGSDAANYTVNQPIITTANITLLAIDVAADGENKVYDGNTTAQVTLSGAGVIAGDKVSFIRNAANFIDKNVGTNKPIDVTGISTSGNDGGNYTVNTTATTKANITPLAITLTAEGVNKVYNGNRVATVNNVTSRGIISSDQVNINYNNASFDNKNVGTGKTVSVNGITLTGSDSGNYIVNQPVIATANITPLAITLTAKGLNKVYNGNRVATINNVTSRGIISSDQVTINYKNASARFGNKNVGAGKRITVNGITLTGSDAGNYIVNQPVITTADITPLAITIKARGRNKFYDGNTKARVVLNPVGIIPGDSIIFDYGSANFVSKGEGENIRINVKGIIAKGLDAANYTINTQAITSAQIFAINPLTDNPLLPLYRENRYTLQSVTAALQKPLTGCLYNSYGVPLTGCSFKNFEKLNISIIKKGVNLPNQNQFIS